MRELSILPAAPVVAVRRVSACSGARITCALQCATSSLTGDGDGEIVHEAAGPAMSDVRSGGRPSAMLARVPVSAGSRARADREWPSMARARENEWCRRASGDSRESFPKAQRQTSPARKTEMLGTGEAPGGRCRGSAAVKLWCEQNSTCEGAHTGATRAATASLVPKKQRRSLDLPQQPLIVRRPSSGTPRVSSPRTLGARQPRSKPVGFFGRSDSWRSALLSISVLPAWHELHVAARLTETLLQSAPFAHQSKWDLPTPSG
jgi:hypothetical protein